MPTVEPAPAPAPEVRESAELAVPGEVDPAWKPVMANALSRVARDARERGFEGRLVCAVSPPFLVVHDFPVEEAEGLEHLDAERRARAVGYARRSAFVLGEVHRHFLAGLGGTLGMRDIRPDEGPVVVLALWDVPSWVRWHPGGEGRRPGTHVVSGTHDVVHCVGLRAHTDSDVWRAADGRRQKESETDLAAAAMRVVVGRHTERSAQQAGVAPPVIRSWALHGIAEFAAGFEYAEDAPERLRHERVALRWIWPGESRRFRTYAQRLWPTDTLVTAVDPTTLESVGEGGERLHPQLALGSFRARSWALVHFGWHERERRAALLVCLLDGLRGEAPDAAALKALIAGRESDGSGMDPDSLRPEGTYDATGGYESYWHALLSRRAGEIYKAGVATGRWREPSTEAPVAHFR